MTSKPAVTIYEIAKHVGVSPAAVSSALANRHVERRLSPDTVQRIRAAALELGYVPNMAGRRLRAHKSATRQFVLAILTSFEAPLPLVGQVLRALQAAVDTHTTETTRYDVTIEMFHAGRLCDKPGLLNADRYHGVVITNTLPSDDEFLANARLPYPVVVLGRRIPRYCCVLEAPDSVGRRAAEILLDRGCRRPGVLFGRNLTYTTSNRLAAFTRAVRERTGVAPVDLPCAGLNPREGAATLSQYFAGGGQIDGLFAVNDSLAAGAYHAIRTAARRIPDDIAVVGIGDYELAEYLTPALSTVAGANDAMVAEAVPLLFRQLGGDTNVPQEVVVVPPVICRASTQGSAAPNPAKIENRP